MSLNVGVQLRPCRSKRHGDGHFPVPRSAGSRIWTTLFVGVILEFRTNRFLHHWRPFDFASYFGVKTVNFPGLTTPYTCTQLLRQFIFIGCLKNERTIRGSQLNIRTSLTELYPREKAPYSINQSINQCMVQYSAVHDKSVTTMREQFCSLHLYSTFTTVYFYRMFEKRKNNQGFTIKSQDFLNRTLSKGKSSVLNQSINQSITVWFSIVRWTVLPQGRTGWIDSTEFSKRKKGWATFLKK